MRDINWATVEESQEFTRLAPGGYVCKITSAEDVPDKEYLKLEYDIAWGPEIGYWQNTMLRAGFWGGKFIKSYKTKAQPFFKGFITAIEKSNPSYIWKNDENTLVNRFVGLVLGEEEYFANDGTVKTRLYVESPRSVQAIKDKDFKVPELKHLKAGSQPTPPPYDEDNNLPFDL